MTTEQATQIINALQGIAILIATLAFIQLGIFFKK